MAYVYKGLDGKNMAEIIASLDEVQGEVWERTFEIAARAEALLVQHRVEGVAKIDMAKGDIDAYVVLEDTNKTNARKSNNSAASIELGRGGYTVEVVNARGQVVNEYEVAPAEGLHILAEASHLPKRSRGLRAATEKRVKVKQRKKKRGGGRG
ncbi:DUF5403 family protein [Streptomyces sp. ME02-6977A]|uniref:DUF5403 family protein n=1 Tax=Streptomyces sp. ME02-6977A TaxID=3028671 RepID=UPI0029A3F90F|nr:DUF5403 family protein [Streptomyces sp. ME02-6977A]MDX3405152.1 DUF5403 family protein [Streptomyces sp. ME02-6977A]